jgi:hypothetical protein
MDRMSTAARTELLDRELVGLALLVLAGRVVSPFAAVTGQSDYVSHLKLLSGPSRPPFNPDPCQSLKAHDGNRTRDLLLTKEVLYRLSYMGR